MAPGHRQFLSQLPYLLKLLSKQGSSSSRTTASTYCRFSNRFMVYRPLRRAPTVIKRKSVHFNCIRFLLQVHYLGTSQRQEGHHSCNGLMEQCFPQIWSRHYPERSWP